MLWYVAQRFRDTAAVWAPKLDELLAELAALLSGGLGLENIKAGTQFPTTAFNEPASIALLRGRASGAVWTVNLGGPIPVAAKIVAFGAKGMAVPSQNVDLYVGAVKVSTLTLVNGRGTKRCEPAIDVAAGDTLSVQMAAVDALNEGDIVVALRVPHVV